MHACKTDQCKYLAPDFSNVTTESLRFTELAVLFASQFSVLKLIDLLMKQE